MRFTVTFTHRPSGKRFQRAFNATSHDDCVDAARDYLAEMVGENAADFAIKVR